MDFLVYIFARMAGRINFRDGNKIASSGTSGFYQYVGGVWSQLGSSGGSDTHTGAGANSFIGGGEDNQSIGDHSSTVGGYTNINSGEFGFIGGGESNSIGNNSQGAVIAGGSQNLIIDTPLLFQSSIVGGANNQISGNYCFIGGGYQNLVNGSLSAVLGGFSNQAFGSSNLVLGGYNNKTSGEFSSILVGAENEITSSGTYSIILGGTGCSISAAKALAFGVKAVVTHSGAAVFADGQDRNHVSQGNNTVYFDYSGGLFSSRGITANNSGTNIYLGGLPGSESSFAGVWLGYGAATASASNYAFLASTAETYFNAPPNGRVLFRVGNSTFGVIDSSGAAFPGHSIYKNPSTQQLTIQPTSSTKRGVVVLGAASQSANLTEWQNSSSGVLSYVDATGAATFAGAYRTGANTNASGELVTFSQGQRYFGRRATSLSTYGTLSTSGGYSVVSNGNIIVAHTSTSGSSSFVCWENLVRIHGAGSCIFLNRCNFNINFDFCAPVENNVFCNAIIGIPEGWNPNTTTSGIPDNPSFGFVQYSDNSGRFFWTNSGAALANLGTPINVGSFATRKSIDFNYNRTTRVIECYFGVDYAIPTLRDTFTLTGSLQTDTFMSGRFYGMLFHAPLGASTTRLLALQNIEIAEYV